MLGMGSNNRVVYKLTSSYELPTDRLGSSRILPTYCITFYIYVTLCGGPETWSSVLAQAQESNHKRASASTISSDIHIATIPKSVKVDGVIIIDCVLSINLGLYLVIQCTILPRVN